MNEKGKKSAFGFIFYFLYLKNPSSVGFNDLGAYGIAT